jgi:protein-disulfide isomerase
LALALIVIGLVAAACAPAAPQATEAPQPAATVAPATGAPAPTAATGGEAAAADIPVGVDADGNFYRGDPKAAVKLVEYSDFQ